MVTYKEAGVDIDAGAELILRLKKICPEIGGFGGLYPQGDNYLVAGTDGVGTKLKLAFEFDQHDTIGIDLVAMCVNDIITTGATPLFFLDYFATSKLAVDQAEMVLKGVVAGCREAACVLLGGETAEMPGFYREGEYDISGFAVGTVPKTELIDGKQIKAGDCLIGIPSSGLHSNGFSLVRKLGFTKEHLTPTRIYVNLIQEMKRYTIKGMAHITGGGVTENIPRMFPQGLGALVDKKSWSVPAIFHPFYDSVSEEELYRTFNMGMGMVLAIPQEEAGDFINDFPECIPIGKVVEGKGVSWV